MLTLKRRVCRFMSPHVYTSAFSLRACRLVQGTRRGRFRVLNIPTARHLLGGMIAHLVPLPSRCVFLPAGTSSTSLVLRLVV